MRPPFPGMDPWLEHPAIWPDVHNRLIAAIADAMSPVVAPKYYIGLESRTNLLTADELAFIGVPDLAVSTAQPILPTEPFAPAGEVAVLEVEVPISEEIRETYLEVRDVKTRKLVTLIELLSPANKIFRKGRRKYERKRACVLDSLTNLVEIDLLRAGKPMPWNRGRMPSDYRILISREPQRPRAHLYAFGVRGHLPTIPLPLLPGDEEPPIDLGAILHALYDRARFDLRLDYDAPPVPPLNDADAAWARGIILEGMA